MIKEKSFSGYHSKSNEHLSLSERVILFSRFLKNKGFKVFPSSVVDALRSVEGTGICNREEFFYSLRANFVTNDMEWKIFGELFEEFWQDFDIQEDECKGDDETHEQSDGEESDSSSVIQVESELQVGSMSEDPVGDDSGRPATYSPVSRLERKNFSEISTKDILTTQLILRKIISPFKTVVRRRYRRSKRAGDIDFRRVIRHSLKAEGVPLELFYRRKKKRLKRLVVLADVSGSMDRYARFVMPFIMGLADIGSRVEIFVFSTSLTPVTPILRRYDINRALETISRRVLDWSGGTRIGYSLHQFNRGYGDRFLNKQTVIVILSDGWDLGGRNILKREMENLSRKAHAVVWLNPLAGDSDYRPICMGMQTALPYVDYFFPANNMESLKRVGKTLSSLVIH
ncbi:MAG: VWA domain-containing protein [Deltaproteobacteria bacterium]|nr:VWA domain-containing protein [Deltaproteobacteria bacterium]